MKNEAKQHETICLGFIDFLIKTSRFFHTILKMSSNAKTVLLVPVTKAAFPMVNSSLRCSHQVSQVCLQIKPGVRVGLGPFRVTLHSN